MTRKNRKKLRYFQLPPNLAHGKFIDLANYVPSSSPRGALSFTQRFFRIWENGAAMCDVTSFATNESLYRWISTKYKSRKLFWRILENNKQKKLENRGNKTVWILRADRRFVQVCSTCCYSFPLGLRLTFRLQILAYFDELYQQIHVCLSLTRYFDGNLKKTKRQTLQHEGRRSIECHYAN